MCDTLSYSLQSLLLLLYLIRNGSERVVTNAREHIYDMKPLEEFTFRDEAGKDQGINGTSCYKVILDLLITLQYGRKQRK